jgi:hypothetical protein
MLPSRETAEQQRRVAHGIDMQANAAPFERIAFTGNQVLKRDHMPPIPWHTYLNIAKRKP